MLIQKLEEMFQEMVVKKNPATIPDYYHPDFFMQSNDVTMDYEAFVASHHEIYATPIEYNIEIDGETVVEQGNKVAAKVWITTKRPNEPAVKIEVMLIAEYKEGKLYRIWELTYPDWSKLPAFEHLES